jgi:hypothetical protein
LSSPSCFNFPFREGKSYQQYFYRLRQHIAKKKWELSKNNYCIWFDERAGEPEPNTTIEIEYKIDKIEPKKMNGEKRKMLVTPKKTNIRLETKNHSRRFSHKCLYLYLYTAFLFFLIFAGKKTFRKKLLFHLWILQTLHVHLQLCMKAVQMSGGMFVQSYHHDQLHDTKRINFFIRPAR